MKKIIILLLLMSLTVLHAALSGTAAESLRREENAAKLREKNAEEVMKLQNQFKQMIEEKKQRRQEDREAMRESAIFNGDLDSFDHAAHEHFAAEQVERYHERSKLDQSRRRRSRTGSSKTTSEDGFSDERAIYFMSQIRKKASLVAHHLETIGSKLSEEELHDLNQQIVDYIEKEKVVGAYVQRTADEFNKAREIEDRDARLKYLDKVKKARDNRLPEERAARERAREHYMQIRAKIDPILYAKEL